MKVAAPYRCDVCLAPKGAANHWWLHPVVAGRFTLLPWDGLLADREGYQHLCSAACAYTALSKWMAAAVAPAAPQPDDLERHVQEVAP